ncbi:MAG TPA: DUF2474 domain-containing protein [Rhodospirillaceae bacterium]|nr:DUF2474 domain-containing protein [Rhodospirillaceae bacterium]
MTPDPTPNAEADARGPRQPLGKRLLWFAVLWIAGVAAVGAVAYLIRLILLP